MGQDCVRLDFSNVRHVILTMNLPLSAVRPTWRSRLAGALVACLLVGPWPATSVAAPDMKSLVLLLRHAYAPGTSDPTHFNVNDCRTQRNLDALGQAQARAIGRQLKELGFAPTQVWSSQWCRASETATLLGLGPVTALPALNSFFRNPADGPAQIETLRRFIQTLDPKAGPYVMVTHQVVVSGLASAWVQSGAGVWLVLTGDPAEPWKVHTADTAKLNLPPNLTNSGAH